MEEAFNLLDIQATGWPKWQIAKDADGEVEYVKHLFVVDWDVEPGWPPAPEPVCRFVDGAKWVERVSAQERELESDGDPLCMDCMEVSLQHGLARMC